LYSVSPSLLHRLGAPPQNVTTSAPATTPLRGAVPRCRANILKSLRIGGREFDAAGRTLGTEALGMGVLLEERAILTTAAV